MGQNWVILGQLGKILDLNGSKLGHFGPNLSILGQNYLENVVFKAFKDFGPGIFINNFFK